MNQITKADPKQKKFKIAIFQIFRFIFRNGIGVIGLIMLAGYLITDTLIYLKVATILSITVVGLIFILSTQALYLFGLDKCYVEIEAKFLDLTLYSAFITGTIILLFFSSFY